MKILLLATQILDIGISVTLHIAGLYYLWEREWVWAALVFGMVSLWQIGCHGIKIRKDIEIT